MTAMTMGNNIKPVYLDYAASTPIDSRVLEKMLPYMYGIDKHGIFGNPASSTHLYGWQAKEAVEESRALIADLLGVTRKEIIFTSGATESDNLAILGVAGGYQNKGKHIITSSTEHKAVLDTCRYLESVGYDVDYLKPDNKGLISIEAIRAVIRPDTILISLMHVNNETGVIQDIENIGKLATESKILFHVDAAQSVGKIPMDLNKLNIDLLSISGHKMYGPKGIGALYIRRNPKVNLMAQMHGGGHEFGWRSGTLATHQIVGLAYALKYSVEEMEEEASRLKSLEHKLVTSLRSLVGINFNGCQQHKKVGHINLCVSDIHGEALIASLDRIAVSSGSACSSAVSAGSYVLRAMGLSERQAQSSLRISLGRYTTDQDIDITIAHLVEVISKLRGLDPESI